MSSLVGAALPAFILRQDDVRNADEYFFGNESAYFPAKMLDLCPASENEAVGFATAWWPAGSNLMGGLDGVPENTLLGSPARWTDPWYSLGSNGRLGFVGYTRDQYGSPLAGCTVRCFRTSSNELTAQVVSDGNGFYQATTPYADGHYLVIHKTGSPEVAGASISTLTPA